MENKVCENEEVVTSVRGQWVAAKQCLTLSLDDLNSVTDHLDAYTTLVASQQITRNAKLDEHVQVVSRMKELAGLLIEFCEMTPSIGLTEVEKVNDINKIMTELGCPHLLPLPPISSEIVEQTKLSFGETEDIENDDFLNTPFNETSKNCHNINNDEIELTSMPVSSEISSDSAPRVVKKRTKNVSKKKRKSKSVSPNTSLCQSTESLSKSIPQLDCEENSFTFAQELSDANLEGGNKESSSQVSGQNCNSNETQALESVLGESHRKVLTKDEKRKVERFHRYLEKKTMEVEQLKCLVRLLKHYAKISNQAIPRISKTMI